MITFCCSSCQVKFSVEKELAGEQGKCPDCGQMVPAPVQAASPATRAIPTLPPLRNHDATQGFDGSDTGRVSGLTDFLAPAQADDELGRLGKYRILKVVGHGGMGVVFQAEDLRLRRKVAIKAMLPALAANDGAGKRFLQEAQATAAVEHDHIVRIYQVDEERDVPFLAMEFLKGETLEERLRRDERLPLSEILRIGKEIAEGLGAAHATGLIHRDVKPANVWLEAPRGRVKILDFGLARALSQDAGPVEDGTVVVTPSYAASGLTQQGAIIGTPAFMAPEQARGQTVDARSDLFSLGCVLYRMCTGQLPFQGKDTMSTLLAVASVEPPAPVRLNAELPRELSDLVMTLLEKDPERRPASAGEVVRRLEALQKPEPKAGRKRTLLIALCLLALLPLTWWLATVIIRISTPNGTLVVEMADDETEARIKNGKLILTDAKGKTRYVLTPSDRNNTIDTGEYKVRVEGADGLALDTTEFTLEKGDKVTVRVKMDPKAVAKNQDPDRKAAEYVLSIGGVVGVNGQNRAIRVAIDLPSEAFRLTVVNLANNKHASDAGLANFKGCKNLTDLNLVVTQVSDAGLAHFSGCKNLTVLWLGDTQVSDAGLSHFKDCKDLTWLALNTTKASDAGLAHFEDCKNLRILNLDNSQVTDTGLAHFEDCKNLTQLWLNDTKVGNAGLAHFDGCKNLTHIGLNGTKVSDVGLANFKDCKSLMVLNLGGTKVSDTGLANFEDSKNLMNLDLRKTKVSAAKIEALKKALPKCIIVWDDPDRRAAEYVLSVGGAVCVNDFGPAIRIATGLPPSAFRLTWVNLYQNKQVNDAGLAHFAGCKNLMSLYLNGTQVGDAGLAHFKDCKNLTWLGLDRTKVTDAGLARFAGCKHLVTLGLGGTEVSDKGLAHFANCKNLTRLDLWQTKVGDAGLVHFKDCKNLTWLNLNKTKVGDAGLFHFEDCKNLTFLELSGTEVSDAGLAHFSGCKNLTQIHLGNTQVGDAGLENFKGCKNLRSLGLWGTKVSDAGLANFKDCKNLTDLDLNGAKVSDAGLAHFTDWKNLTWLGLANTKVSDAVLAYFVNCKNLKNISLRGTKVSDAGLADLKIYNLTSIDLANTQVSDAGLIHLEDFENLIDLNLNGTKVGDKGLAHLEKCKNLRNLSTLDLGNTKVSDAGLAHLEVCKNLTWLGLGGTQVSDKGLAHFADWKNLIRLDLWETQVGDAGLAHFEGCKNLTELYLKKSKVTAAKIEELKKALPRCKIEWDGGVIEPK